MPVVATDIYPGKPGRSIGVDSPACHAQVVGAGSDTDDLTYTSRALVIGTGGVVKVTTRGGDGYPGEDVILTLPAGVIPLRVTRVWAAGMTAANITAIT